MDVNINEEKRNKLKKYLLSIGLICLLPFSNLLNNNLFKLNENKKINSKIDIQYDKKGLITKIYKDSNLLFNKDD